MTDEALKELIRQAHEFATQTTCSVPESNPICARARAWLAAAEPITTPDCVRLAFENDHKRQANPKTRL